MAAPLRMAHHDANLLLFQVDQLYTYFVNSLYMLLGSRRE
jgi:hypothetical protein